MTTTQIADKNNSKSLAIKLISVVGLTIFTGFYVNSWQRSLNNYYAEQKQEETKVASAMPPVTQEKQASLAMASAEETQETAAVIEVSKAPEAIAVAPEITDTTTINSLKGKLYQEIDITWRQVPSFTENLVYKVEVTKEGAIAQYQHINKAALDYIQETPLPNLSSSAKIGSMPTAEFLVVLTPTGLLQVTPWVGK
jgi:hypothetical protein